MKIIRILSSLILLIHALSNTLLAEEANTIMMGPNFQKNQTSARKLIYHIPDSWYLDKETSRNAGLHAVLLPIGKTLANTKQAITIAFQRKDANTPRLKTLEEFFRVDINNTLNQFPDMQAVRWQPPNLNPDNIPFMSIELFGIEKGKPSPARVLFIDAQDGYFSITLTVEDREDLNKDICNTFFNGIDLQ